MRKKGMEYNAFVLELIQRLLDNPNLHLEERDVRYLADGFEAEDEDEDIRSEVRTINLRYNNLESYTLVGDFLLVYMQHMDTPSPDEVKQATSRFPVAKLYKAYQRNPNWDDLMNDIEEGLSNSALVRNSGVVANLTNFEAIKDRLIIRAINYTDNNTTLEMCVYRRVEDIALCLYLVVEDGKTMLNTTKVTRELFDKWGDAVADEEAIWQMAMVNTQVFAPPRLYTDFHSIIQRKSDTGVFMREDFKLSLSNSPLPMPIVLTTTRQVNGAVALFYPGVQERLAQLLNNSYYIAFTSIHEAHIHPYGSVRPSTIRDNLLDTIRAFSAEETLTRRVFFYDAKRHCLKVKA